MRSVLLPACGYSAFLCNNKPGVFIMVNTSRHAAKIQNDPRWAAVVARNAAKDGSFVYSVKTTGVYCRPGCPSRPARPENIAFHTSAKAAENAGFRPCKRCKPDQRSLAEEHAEVVTILCRYIEATDQTPTLAELAAQCGWSTYHLHRTFKAVCGLTPKAYAAAHRAKRVRDHLGSSATVTHAIYDAGYNSSGRFYEESNAVLGMTPTAYRAGGLEMDIEFATGTCSLGVILVAQSKRGICTILLGDDPAVLVQELKAKFPAANLVSGDKAFQKLISQVVSLIEAPGHRIDLPLDIRGTTFQRQVWEVLRSIPSGETLSYTEVAERLGAPKSVRAVAQACAANVLAVAIPCHRVVRNDGALSGYRWGVDRKRILLDREKDA
jgi:AraC family transcriptional regulator of adaptative response/methylated-DNA-[protein]-cysteine methyltransferase